MSKKIVKISVCIKEGKYLHGLRLIDDAGANVVNIIGKDEGDWIEKDIPVGKEIIGLYCNTKNGELYESIHRFGFMVWTPNPDAK